MHPTPTEIRVARLSAGLTQTQAGALVVASCRSWQQWEAGQVKMHPGLWRLFLRETGQASLPATAPPHPHRK